MNTPTMNGISLWSDVNNHLSVRMYNNTIISGCMAGYGITLGYLDSLDMKNNIVMMDSSQSEVMRFGGGGINEIPYKSIDYNQYYINTRAVRVQDISTTHTWPIWQTLGYDVHGSNIGVTFVNNWGTDVTDYELTRGLDTGVDLSAYFTKDIRGVTRPQGTGWDRGALESK